jgi:hypothetical protein
MTGSTDPIAMALAELARRADLHQPADRLAAIGRRSRRAAARRMTGILTAVAAVGALVIAAGLGWPPLSGGEPPGSRPTVQPTDTAPHLTVRLEREDAIARALPTGPEGLITMVVQVTLTGLVPQPVVPTDQPTPTGPYNLLGFAMTWGDVTYDRRTPSGYRCVPGARLVNVNTHFLMTHYYAMPGIYTVTYHTAGCDPVGSISGSLTLHVP